MFNNYPWPPNLATEYAAERGITEPPGGLIITGIAMPVLLALAVGVVAAFLATRRQFGRHALFDRRPRGGGGSRVSTPAGRSRSVHRHGHARGDLAAVISARLNAAAISIGTGIELQVIAAAVIGGTSFAGGIGKISGGILGAVVMQSLSSGMVLIGVDTAMQDIVVGLVLVSAVGVDTVLRRRAT